MASNLEVPFVDLTRQFIDLESDFISAFSKIGRSGSYILGPEVEQFEQAVADYCGVKHAIGVGDGSAALFLPLKALDIGHGDEVVTAANSFIASAWVIAAAGATPVLTDVSDDLNMCPRSLASAISPRTRAIMPVHLAGHPADMDVITNIATEAGIPIIEDAAQAIGARYKGRQVGSFGLAAGFSLHPLKNLGVYGDGGFITTNDDALADKVRLLRNHGLKSRDDCVMWGYNSRLDSIQAALALIKLKHLPRWNQRCREIAECYRRGLEGFVKNPKVHPNVESVYHNFIIETPYRDALAKHLKGEGIGTAIHYPVPIHLQTAAKHLGYRKGSFPVTESLCETMLSLPIYPHLTDSEVDYVVDRVVSFFKQSDQGGRV